MPTVCDRTDVRLHFMTVFRFTVHHASLTQAMWNGQQSPRQTARRTLPKKYDQSIQTNILSTRGVGCCFMFLLGRRRETFYDRTDVRQHFMSAPIYAYIV